MDKEAYGKMVNIWNSLKITLAMMCTQMKGRLHTLALAMSKAYGTNFICEED